MGRVGGDSLFFGLMGDLYYLGGISVVVEGVALQNKILALLILCMGFSWGLLDLDVWFRMGQLHGGV